MKHNTYLVFIVGGILLLAFVLGLSLPIVSAQLIFERNTYVELQVPCFNNYTICSDATTCNITILYPNSSVLINNQLMTNLNTGYHNYTLNNNQTHVIGEHKTSIFCMDGDNNGYSVFDYAITPLGQEITTGQGFASIGLIISIILLASFFSFFGFKFTESDKLYPIGLFFMLVSMILGVYVIHLGYIYSRDILFPIAMESVQFKVYIGIMYGLIGMAFIGLLLLIVKTLKEFRERKSLINYGEGWDTNKSIYKN